MFEKLCTFTNHYNSIVDNISNFCAVFVSWLTIPLIIATVFEVISRYFFNAPTIWAFEVATMATGTLLLMGSPYALKEKVHIRIDIFNEKFNCKTRCFIDIVGYAIFIIPLGFWLSYKLGSYALEAYLTGERSGESTWNPPIWPYRIVFFFGFLLLSLQSISECIKSIQKFFTMK